MPVQITIDIFSGRPNPVVELDGKDAREVLERLKPTTPLSGDEAERAATAILGYRGLVVEQTGTSAASRELPARFRVSGGRLTGRGLAHNAADRDFEDFFFGPKGHARKAKDTKITQSFLKAEVTRGIEIKEQLVLEPLAFPLIIACTCGPIYEPAWWNDGGQKQLHNNCYNYGTNYRTDTFAQPGLAAGAMYSTFTCASVLPAAVKDGLEDTPGANNKCPAEGHLVALVMAPGIDFHWYRKGSNGLWTHKPGPQPVTNIDNSGQLIVDPRTANRGMYTVFCTFMVVKHGHTKIK